MKRKECRKYYFSVEGDTEEWYLKWLEKQINQCDDAEYKVDFLVKRTKNPNKFVKELSVLSKTKIVHVFDFEDRQNEMAFQNTLKVMKDASKLKGNINYYLGYSNYTFDLWMVLHKKCVMGSKSYRSHYLIDINRYYNTDFESMEKYKEKNNFKKVLDCLDLDDVKNAILNAEKIENQNVQNYQKMTHCGFEYYRENPSLSIHKYIKDILMTVKLL